MTSLGVPELIALTLISLPAWIAIAFCAGATRLLDEAAREDREVEWLESIPVREIDR